MWVMAQRNLIAATKPHSRYEHPHLLRRYGAPASVVFSWAPFREAIMRWLICLLLLSPLAAAQTTSTNAARTLHALFDRTWDYEMEQHPTRASSLGDRRWNDRWGDDSPTAVEARHR